MGRPTDPNFWQQSPPPQTGDMNNERTLNQRFMRELPGALPPQDVIIHDGAISGFESAALIVDTEGEAAADELNVINIVLSANENLHPGMIITLRAKDPARVVTIKNSAAANGINTADGNDIVLSPDWELTLRLVAGRWYEIQTRGTAPATTTSRGIGRVATAADMEPGAVVTNGPAFLDAATVKITSTPTANAVPQAGEDGTLDASWVPRPDYWDMFPPFVPIPIWGVTFGGSDGRRAIMPGEAEAREDWLLCDGGNDGKGGVVPNLMGRVLLGADTSWLSGSSGGSSSHSHDVTANTAATTLSQAQMPSHNHGFTAYVDNGYWDFANGQEKHIRNAGSATSYSGSNASHSHSVTAATNTGLNMMPFFAMDFVIKITQEVE